MKHSKFSLISKERVTIRDFRYKNAIIHISGEVGRDTLEDAATRFFKKVYMNKKKLDRTDIFDHSN